MSTSAKRWAGAVLVAVTALAAAESHAHDTRPLAVTIVEQGEAIYRVVVRAPPTLDAANAPRLIWPQTCDVRESQRLRLELGAASLIACREALDGQQLRIDYPLYNPSITTLIRLEPRRGAARTAVLAPDTLVWSVPDAADWRTVARDYTWLGIQHIWTGLDHLLFVAGLMLLARGPRRTLLAITGFTVAHSLTLSFAVLGLVHVPIEPVEAMIALSILFLAGELARGASDTFSRRYPLVLAFVFGLLHGFGFASALGEIGLPPAEIAIGLLSFNVGVELGQLAFIALAAMLPLAWQRARAFAPLSDVSLEARMAPIAAYALGVPAAFWFLERTVAAFAA